MNKLRHLFWGLILLAGAFINAGEATAISTTAFWKNHTSILKFTTAAQSIKQSVCSGIATVQTLNFQGVVTNVGSNLTVSLSGSNLTFFSDSDCANLITSVTVSTGTNTSSFYFVASATGSRSITASATGYLSVSQAETISTNPYIWTGNGGNSNWSTAGNWSGGAAPGSTNIAIFDGTCVSNCSPDITANPNVGGVRQDSTYMGTITQNSGVPITIGSSGWIQAGGTFNGSSSGDAITITGSLGVSGGSYKATSGILQVNGRLFKAAGTSTFAHNSGTIHFNQPWGWSPSIIPGSTTYNHVKFTGDQSNYDLNGGSMAIAGDLTIANTSVQGYGKLSNGTILLSGNLIMNSYGYLQSSGLTLKLVGNASGQTITGASTSSIRADFIIDTGSNPVTLSGTLNINAANFTVTSVGTFTATGSTFIFNMMTGTRTISAGGVMLNNVQFVQSANGPIAVVSGTLNVGGTLTLDGQNNLNGGTINAYGDIVTGTNFYSGSATIVVSGNASGQTISGTTASAKLPNLTIAAGSNNVTFSGTVGVGRNFTYASGNVITTGSTVVFTSDCTAPTISTGSIVFNDIQFSGTNCSTMSETISGTINVAGNVLFATAHGLNGGGTITMKGNLSITAVYISNVGLTFNGTTGQTITQTSGSSINGAFVVNNPSGVTLGSNLTWNGATQSTTVTTGSINMAGYNLTIRTLSLNGNVITKGGGILTVSTGSSPYGGTVNP